MRNFFLIIFIVTFCSFNLCKAGTVLKDKEGNYNLENESYTIHGRVQAGFLTGTANEIVYYNSSSDVLLSKLIWKIDKQYMAGVGFSIQEEWVAVHVDFWNMVTEGDGTMDDYDWLLFGQEWSHWSHHDDTSVTGAYIFDINCEYIIVQELTSNNIVTGFLLGYKREYYEWQAKGGFYIYSDNSWRDLQGNITPELLCITYSQDLATPYLGFSLRSSFGELELNGQIIASSLVSIKAKDTHHLRSLNTIASLSNGEMYSFIINLSYSITDSFTLGVGYSQTKYSTVRGNSTYNWYGDGVTATYVNVEGADLETEMLSFELSYFFL